MGVITVTDLGKAYKQYPTRWSRLAEWVLPGQKSRHKLKWVLQDINFCVKPGEAVGIIGINGAGKSTLLKMITGTSQPTTGFVKVTGRIAALLELGMGFHPDFTGRQNVFMAGQLIGLGMQEIAALMPAIENFAEIGEYIDQPVRVYSSGMQMRLAFSVATARRPDVLIVDEALSVGDAYFQHKSMDRIREFRKAGTTLLLVSHDKQAIQSLCDRAIFLNRGLLAMEGDPEAVTDYYNAMLAERQNQNISQERVEGGKMRTVSGTGEAVVESIHLYNAQGEVVEIVNVGEIIELCIVVRVLRPINKLVLGYGIKDRLGQVIFGTNTWYTDQVIFEPQVGRSYTYRLSFPANIGVGTYSIQTALVDGKSHLTANYEWRDLSLVFTVLNSNKDFFLGSSWIPPKISIFPWEQSI